MCQCYIQLVDMHVKQISWEFGLGIPNVIPRINPDVLVVHIKTAILHDLSTLPSFYVCQPLHKKSSDFDRIWVLKLVSKLSEESKERSPSVKGPEEFFS